MVGWERLACAPLVLAAAACAATGEPDLRIVKEVPVAQPIQLVSAQMSAVAEAPAVTEPLSVIVRVSGEAYEMPPAFDLYLGGRLVGHEAVDWARPTEKMGQSGAFRDGVRVKPGDGLEWRQVEFRIPDASLPVDQLRIAYTNNDIENGGELPPHLDRNLIVDWVEIDGVRIQAEDPRVAYSRGGTLMRSREKMSWNGDMIFALKKWDELAHLTAPVAESRAIAQATPSRPADTLE